MHIICITLIDFLLASCVISNDKSLISHNQVMQCFMCERFIFINTIYRENLEGISLNGLN